MAMYALYFCILFTWCDVNHTLHIKEEMIKKIEETNQWNPETYNKHTAFVSQLALPVVELLSPQKGEYILDAGCGDGTLAIEIEKYGVKVVGVDMSKEMVEPCHANGIESYVGSVTDLPYEYEYEFDAVFSNAMLHWVKDAKSAGENIAKTLKKGGRFVAEFGGAGNMHHVVAAMQKVFDTHPEFGVFENPWYFPSPKEYQALLESVGFTEHLSKEQFSVFKNACRDILGETNYTQEQGWMLDYVRLRVEAVKI